MRRHVCELPGIADVTSGVITVCVVCGRRWVSSGSEWRFIPNWDDTFLGWYR